MILWIRKCYLKLYHSGGRLVTISVLKNSPLSNHFVIKQMNSLDPEMLYQHFALLKNYIIQFLLSVALISPSLLVQFEQLD
jgi:hypothetical protein